MFNAIKYTARDTEGCSSCLFVSEEQATAYIEV